MLLAYQHLVKIILFSQITQYIIEATKTEVTLHFWQIYYTTKRYGGPLKGL